MCAAAIGAAPAPPTGGADPSRGEALLAKEIEMIRRGRRAEAERSFSRKLAAQRSPRARADLIGSFAVQLFLNAPELDDATSAEVLDHLERAVDAYRLVLGVDAPEVATALVRRAEVERLLHPADPAPWTDMAYEQAYRIRFQRFGGSSPITLSTLIPMAGLRALPSRTKGDPAEIEAAAALLRQVVESAGASTEDEDHQLRAEAQEALERLDAAYGEGQPGGRRPQIMTAGIAQQCAATDLHDAIIFSGEPAALQTLRDRFQKAKLSLMPCGSMLVFPIGGGVDPTPVLDLLTEISAGRMKGVRMGLGDDGDASAASPPGAGVPTPDGP
ncbi:hypothetical protein ASD39_19785 [Sphingomonas sp. Root50]|nr:hypothetical protein ASD17_15190 [Sphingomonas sp. Root1294]KQY72180.1 hypothetical protein ASD39_19785 [Sphingomonas sp. Root50]KRB94547.1 hypothetical protein ASE22_00965 [Sphingomonas sp. Root720]